MFPVTIVTKSEKVTSLRKSHVSRLSEHGVTKRVMIHKMEIEAVPTETRTAKEGEEIQSNGETRKLNVPLKDSLRGRQNLVDLKTPTQEEKREDLSGICDIVRVIEWRETF